MIKKEKDSLDKDSFTYSHESFGMISVSRYTCGGQPLFGSDFLSSTVMNVTISNADVTQRLGKNWYSSTSVVASADLTPAQYAEMISSPNTIGVPCTIKTTQSNPEIVYEPIESVQLYIKNKAESTFDDITSSNKETLKKVVDLLEGNIKKSDKDEIIKSIRQQFAKVDSTIPFLKEQFNKDVDKSVSDARVEVHSLLTQVISEYGSSAIKKLGSQDESNSST